MQLSLLQVCAKDICKNFVFTACHSISPKKCLGKCVLGSDHSTDESRRELNAKQDCLQNVKRKY